VRVVSLPLVRFGPVVASRPLVVHSRDATEDATDLYATDLYATDGPPSDPTMTAAVTKVLDDSIPVTVVSGTPSRQDASSVREHGEALS